MYLYWILALIYVQSLWAAEVGLSVDAREIFVGIPFELSVIAQDFEESPEPKVEPFDLPDCEVQFVGAFPSSSRQITIVNGRRTDQIEVKMEYKYVVRAKKSGTIIVPPIRVSQGTTVAQSQKASLQVKNISKTDSLKVALVLPNKEVRVGATSDVYIDIYTNKELNNLDLSVPFLELSEYLSIEETQPTRRQRTLTLLVSGVQVELPYTVSEQTYNRRKYTRYRLQTKVNFIKSGKIEIEPTQVFAEVAVGQSRNRFGFPTTRYQRFKAVDQIQQITVQPLPLQGRPKSFMGAIGSSYAIEARVMKSVIEVGEPVELEIVIKGKGNLDGLQLPDLEVMGFDKNKFDIPQKESLIGELQEDGSKKFTPSIQVNNPAVSEIPKLEFSYFDLSKERYERVYSSPIALSVKDRESIGAQNVVRSNSSKIRSNQSQKSNATSLNNEFYLTGANLTLSDPSQTFVEARHISSIKWLVALLYGLPISLFAFFQYRSNTSESREERSKLNQARKDISNALQIAKTESAQKSVRDLSLALKNWAHLNDMNVSKIISQLEIEAYSPNADRDSLSTSILQEIEGLISGESKTSQQGKSSSSIALLFIFALGSHFQTAYAEPVDINTLRTQYQNALSIEERGKRVEEFTKVMNGFDSLTQSHPYAAEIYVDMGNAALGAAELGTARYAFEKAQHLQPRSTRAKQNISWIETQLPEWTRSSSNTSTLDRFLFWSSIFNIAEQLLISGLFFALAVGMLLFLPKKLQLFIVVTFLLWSSTVASALLEYQSTEIAVIQAEAGPLRSADNEGAPAVTKEWLPEGSLVKVLNKNSNWTEVSLFSGTKGWIPNRSLRVIEKE